MDILQALAKVDLVCGLAAICLQESRHCFRLASYCARAAAGTLPVTQASYFVRKSSHSAMPIFSPAEADLLEVLVFAGVVFAGVVAVAAGVAAGVIVVAVLLPMLVELVVDVLVSDPPQAASRNAQASASDRQAKIRFDIKDFSFNFGPARTG